MSFEINGNKIIINKPLVDVEEAFDLANELNKIIDKELENIIINMQNAHTLPSIIIGKLMVLKETGINIDIIIYDDFTYTLFNDLGLTSFFNVKLSKK